jgi:hypothetical protein
LLQEGLSSAGFRTAELYTNQDELGKDFHAELEAFVETAISMHRIELAEEKAPEVRRRALSKACADFSSSVGLRWLVQRFASGRDASLRCLICANTPHV